MSQIQLIKFFVRFFEHARDAPGEISIVPFPSTRYKSAENPKEHNKNLKILVTGGAGFIGSHVVDRFVRDGHDVVVLDNLVTGSRRNLNPDARFVELDIRDRKGVANLFATEQFDILDHHAAQMDVRKSTEDPLYDAEVNILGSLNLIAGATRHGVKKFIYVSTGGAVYGEPQRLPVEEGDAVNPECQYGISKHTVEHYLYLYRLLYKLNYVVLRYPNVFGPRQNPSGEAGVIAIFAGQMMKGKTPTIFGDGRQLRDYVFVGDVAEANALALDHGDGVILNIGSERGTSVLELFDHLTKLTGAKDRPKFAPLRPGEINKIYLSGRKAKEILGWQPSVSVEEGLRRTVEWMQQTKRTGQWR
jgi:UDP-glucose 4-epimerase